MLRKSPFHCFGRFVSEMANLSDLPYEMLVEIARRLKKLEDYISFSSVSKSLRAAAKDEYFEGLWLRQQTPYLTLSVIDDGNDDICEIYSLVEGESVISSLNVPMIKGKKCFESLGWLLCIEEDGTMSLLDATFAKQGHIFSDVVGSPYYDAPEVLLKHYSPEADMWTVKDAYFELKRGSKDDTTRIYLTYKR